MNTSREKLVAYIALAAVCFFWGTTYFGIRIAVHYFPPFFLTAFRHIISGSIICAFMLARGHKLPPAKELLKMFVAGFLFLILSNSMINWAELYIPSGLTALLCTFVPWYLLLFNLVMNTGEKINGLTGAGLLIGLLGMVTIFYDSLADVTNIAYLPGILCTVVANIAWASGTIFVKRSGIQTHPVFSSGIQMIMVAFVSIVLSASFGEFERVQFSADGLWAVAYLVVFGSIVGYNCYIYSVSKLPTTIVSVYAYINPVVAVLLGFFFLNEKITPVMVLAMVLTLVGVGLINFGFNRGKQAAK